MEPRDAGTSGDPTLGSLQLSTVPGLAPVRVTWRTPDPDAVSARIRQCGLPVVAAGDDALVELDGDRLAIRRGPAGVLTVTQSGEAPGTPATDAGSARLVAIGVATVDHHRLARELGLAALGDPHDEPALGARAWWVPGARLVLLEPSTEGRLASSLARLGEGPVVLYLELSGREGERGSDRVIRPDRPWGPFVIVDDVPRR